METVAKKPDAPKPFLTIGIFTYQRSKCVDFLLEKLSKQVGLQSDDWEIIVSDNGSKDGTTEVVKSYQSKLPNLRYHEYPVNMGSDKNFFGLFEMMNGQYLWALPDDDWVVDDHAVKSIIQEIRSCPMTPSLVCMNGKSGNIDTHVVQDATVLKIRGSLLLMDGRNILEHIWDPMLYGCVFIIYRRGIHNHSFVRKYGHLKAISPMVVSMAACADGAALIIGKPLVVYGTGNLDDWRTGGPKMVCIDGLKLLKIGIEELGFPNHCFSHSVEERKKFFKHSMPSSYLVFQRFGITWKELSQFYGWKFVICKIIQYFPMAIPHYLLYPFRKSIRKWMTRIKK